MLDHLSSDPRSTLDECLGLVDRLHRMCCEPERSPRMINLRDTITKAQEEIDDSASPDSTRAILENAGAQVGQLQVGCCAPERLPLYHEILDRLNGLSGALAR